MDCERSQHLVKVGELAAETGKSVRTLHYYEELGLLRPSRRSEGGFRLYDASAVNRVRTIEKLQALNVPLNRIRDLVLAWSESGTGHEAAERIRQIYGEELAATRRRIEDLRAIEQELDRSMAFLNECDSCSDRPVRDQCTDCAKGDHKRQLPEFIDAFLL